MGANGDIRVLALANGPEWSGSMGNLKNWWQNILGNRFGCGVELGIGLLFPSKITLAPANAPGPLGGPIGILFGSLLSVWTCLAATRTVKFSWKWPKITS